MSSTHRGTENITLSISVCCPDYSVPKPELPTERSLCPSCQILSVKAFCILMINNKLLNILYLTEFIGHCDLTDYFIIHIVYTLNFSHFIERPLNVEAHVLI